MNNLCQTCHKAGLGTCQFPAMCMLDSKESALKELADLGQEWDAAPYIIQTQGSGNLVRWVKKNLLGEDK